MNVKDLYRIAFATSDRFVSMYLADFSEEEMLFRPGPSANHCAWQLGHMISTEHNLIEAVRPGCAAKLPEGFSEQHSKAKAASNNASDFLSKSSYLELYQLQRKATHAVINDISEADLDAAGPEAMRSLMPTVGAVLYIAAVHPMLHSGQFAVIRRVLGKPILL